MKISIITVCYNMAETIEDTIKSVLGQSYSDIEYIIVDGDSSDETMDIVNKYRERIDQVVSEPDEGLYHAMNKGIGMATGEVVGILNADDFYVDNKVIEKVVERMKETGADCLWGDLDYVSPKNTDKVIREWRPGSKGDFRKGWRPPHPTLFIKKEVYDKYGNFDLEFGQIAADYELTLRFFKKYKISWTYLPEVLVKMRGWGKTHKNPWNVLVGNWECYRAWEKNGLSVSPLFIIRKPIKNIWQMIKVVL